MFRYILLSAALFSGAGALWAVPPVIKLVRAQAGNALASHDTYPGKSIRLKGTTNLTTPGTYEWNFGDGSPVVSGPIVDPYAVEAPHVYNPAGALPQFFSATLKITNTGTLENSTATYTVAVRARTLAVEVNIAIEEGLWYLHKALTRSVNGGQPFGTWQTCGVPVCTGYPFIDPQNTQAFAVNGFLESGDPNDPYTETVQRSMRGVLNDLTSAPISNQTAEILGVGNTLFNPDTNGNGLAVKAGAFLEPYQVGTFMDVLVAANTPNKVVDFGPLANGSRTYKDLVQDMVDYYSFCQSDQLSNGFSTHGGGWRYSCSDNSSDSDNSVNQWAAIGLVAAENTLGLNAPAAVKDHNLKTWLSSTQGLDGRFGYDSPSDIWGPFATTPSGMVQLVWNKQGRGSAAWDKAETFMRDHFDDPVFDATSSVKAYYYGLFSLTKSMLLHDPNPGPGGVPITLMQSSTPGKPPIDWYAAQAPPFGSDSSNGVARTLVNDQSLDGFWQGHDYTTEQWPFETAWAIIMLNRTVFEALPVACFGTTPSIVANGGPVRFDAGCSFHQGAPSRSIVKYEWDFDGDANENFTLLSPQTPTIRNMSALPPYPKDILVRLRVTDNSVPAKTATSTATVRIGSPPLAPSANAGGPYNFCTNRTPLGALIFQPFYVDASRSTNPDQGQTDGTAGAPGSTIVSYQWALDPTNPNTFNGAGALLRVDGPPHSYESRVGQQFNIKVKVTDNDNLAFPTAGLTQGNSSESIASVFVLPPADAKCTRCIVFNAPPKIKGSLPGRPGEVQIYWGDTDDPAGMLPIDHYNVYRSTSAAGPFTLIAGTGAAKPPVKAPRTETPARPIGSQMVFIDNMVISGLTYHYRVAPATLANVETCQSNVTLQVVVTPAR